MLELGSLETSYNQPQIPEREFTRHEIIAIRYVVCILTFRIVFDLSRKNLFEGQKLTFVSKRGVFGAMGVLGLCGCIFVIVSYLLFPRLRSFNKSLIMCMSIADGLSAASDIMSLMYFASVRLPFAYCSIQASLIQYAELSSFVWSLIISIYLFTTAVRNWPDVKTKSLFPLFILFGFFLPLLPVIILQVEKAFGNSTIGPDITWCWIRGEFPFYRLGFYYGPMALIWIINAVLYVLIVRKASTTESAAFNKVVIRLSLYILAALIANLPALINRLQNAIDPKKPIFALFILHAICNPLQGLVDAIVYSLSAPLRAAYRQLFRKLFGLSKPNDDTSQETLPYEHDEEEEAYQDYRRTLTIAHSSMPGHYSTDHESFEHNHLLSGQLDGPINGPNDSSHLYGSFDSSSFSSFSDRMDYPNSGYLS